MWPDDKVQAEGEAVEIMARWGFRDSLIDEWTNEEFDRKECRRAKRLEREPWRRFARC